VVRPAFHAAYDGRFDSEVLLHRSPATVLDRSAPLDDASDRGGSTLGRLPEGVSHERARCLRGISIAELRPTDWSTVGSGSESVSFLGSCDATGGAAPPMASSPRILNRPTDRHRPDTEAMQKARLAVHHRSACSGLKALRNTSAARRQAAKLCYRFGPLTPSARSANLIAGDGTKNGFPAPNKEPATNQNHHLTAKAPYKFESISLQRRVRSEHRRREIHFNSG
jgi:hypothetical protein